MFTKESGFKTCGAKAAVKRTVTLLGRLRERKQAKLPAHTYVLSTECLPPPSQTTAKQIRRTGCSTAPPPDQMFYCKGRWRERESYPAKSSDAQQTAFCVMRVCMCASTKRCGTGRLQSNLLSLRTKQTGTYNATPRQATMGHAHTHARRRRTEAPPVFGSKFMYKSGAVSKHQKHFETHRRRIKSTTKIVLVDATDEKQAALHPCGLWLTSVSTNTAWAVLSLSPSLFGGAVLAALPGSFSVFLPAGMTNY